MAEQISRKGVRQKSIVAVPYEEILNDEWDEFVEKQALNGSILHTRKFYDHNPANQSEDASLIFYRGQRIIALFPAILSEQSGELVLNSHLRATYGGIVVGREVNVEIAVYLVKLIIQFARAKSAKRVVIKNSFRILHNNLCDESDYALWLQGFKIQSREMEIAIPISGNFSATALKYHKGAKRNIHIAKRFIRVAISNDFATFWDILGNCLLKRHGQNPVHSLNEILKLRKSIGPERVILFGAFYNEQMIAGVVVFVVNKLVVQCQYSALDYAFKYYRPIHGVMDHIINWSEKAGIRYVNLGMANEEEGRKMNLGLFRFKEGFGGKGVLRETMCIDID